MSRRPTVFLTHEPGALAVYYGEAALAALREVAEVRLNPTGKLLGTEAFIEAARGCELIVGDVNTPAESPLFDALPDLVAFHRCAVDRRTIDVDAASRNGVLVTNASPGFVEAVSELVFGLMLDLATRMSAYPSTPDGADAETRGKFEPFADTSPICQTSGRRKLRPIE